MSNYSPYVVGLDIGSVSAKAVVRDAERERTLSEAVLPTGWNVAEAGENILESACLRAGIGRDSLVEIVGTGYGRGAIPFVTRKITEISCHARGAHYLFPGTGIVLDFC